MPLTEALIMAVRTDPGKLRSNNEDAVFCDASKGFAILADGMGGYNAGEVASGMATTLLAESLLRTLRHVEPHAFDDSGVRLVHRQLLGSIEEANAEIYFAARSNPRYSGMGTTLVVAWFYGNQLSVAHIGDSRLYLWREMSLERLTRDHSLLQEQLDSGMITSAQARVFHSRNLVTRALGVGLGVEPELRDVNVRAGDIYLLCSDGLSDMVSDSEIGNALRQFGNDPAIVADGLMKMANDYGGRDNISVIVVKVQEGLAEASGRWQKLLSCMGQNG